MKTVQYLILLAPIILSACDSKLPHIANNPPSAQFSFGFNGRLEKLEDAFYSCQFKYNEFSYTTNLQKEPRYGFVIARSDTVINYSITLQDCQSIYYLVKWNDDWKCDSSYIHVDQYTSNFDSIPKALALSIFHDEIIKPLNKKFQSIANEYHWEIDKKADTTFVRILNQDKVLRKLYIYSLDTIGNSIAEKEIYNYLGDSILHFTKSQRQRFVYLESKETIINNNQ